MKVIFNEASLINFFFSFESEFSFLNETSFFETESRRRNGVGEKYAGLRGFPTKII